MSSERGVWLYAVTGQSPHEWLSGVTGVDGETVRAVESAGLFAVVGTVPLDTFGEEALRANLENLDWLSNVARAHDAVIDAAVRRATAIPIRLATVYLDDERVAALLREQGESFTATLRRLDGHIEWGVKGFAEAAAVAAEPDTAVGGTGAGAAYLRQRKAKLSARDDTERLGHDRARVVHAELARLSVQQRAHPPQDPRLTQATTAMVLNGAYLVEHDRADDFAAAVTKLNGDGIRLELTGPWPPYSFAEVDGDRR